MKQINANSLSLYASHMLVVLAAYFPWFLNAESPTIVGRPLLVASVGVFLLASVLLRAALRHRVSSQALVGWVAADFAAWRQHRGVSHWTVVSLLAAGGPLLTMNLSFQEFLLRYFVHIAPGFLFAYGMVYFACRMLEEREASPAPALR